MLVKAQMPFMLLCKRMRLSLVIFLVLIGRSPVHNCSLFDQKLGKLYVSMRVAFGYLALLPSSLFDNFCVCLLVGHRFDVLNETFVCHFLILLFPSIEF